PYSNPRPSVIVEERNLESEKTFLLQWLEAISEYIQDQDSAARAAQTIAQAAEARKHITGATIQFYLWDEVSYEQLARVYARHLEGILGHHALGHLSWLFPSAMVLEDSRYQDGKSPITIVQPMVKS